MTYTSLSLGAGVQSSTLALLCAHGIVKPMPDVAIFADTQDEPENVYNWLDWLEGQLPFQVRRVTAGKLSESALKKKVTSDGKIYTQTNVPVFTLNAINGTQGKVGHRTCTRDYKIRPILKELRKLGRIKRGQKVATVTSYIGISLDEIQRMKLAREPWLRHRWPLVELRMTRQACLDWMREQGYPEPPRSACVFCPFHSAKEWRRLQVEEPQEFEKAVQFERQLQATKAESSNFTTTPYLHKSCRPLGEIDFRSDVERGQLLLDWQDECEGMCGV